MDPKFASSLFAAYYRIIFYFIISGVCVCVCVLHSMLIFNYWSISDLSLLIVSYVFVSFKA